MSQELSCQELVELVTEYLEGVMKPADRRLFEAHLVYCEGCVTYLAQMRETIALVGRLSEEDVSRPARDELMAAFRDWNARR
jgi:anti-sigma factor RsiW